MRSTWEKVQRQTVDKVPLCGSTGRLRQPRPHSGSHKHEFSAPASIQSRRLLSSPVLKTTTRTRRQDMFPLRPSSGESIDRTNDLGHPKPELLAQSRSEEQLVTSLGIEINGGSPPGDGWWEYITANKNLPHCRRGQSPARWQISTPEGEQTCLNRVPAA